MAKKQTSFNAAAGFFEKPETRIEPVVVVPPIQTKSQSVSLQIDVLAAENKKELISSEQQHGKAESRRSFSFFIGEQLDARLLQYVTKQKLLKKKITKTDVICMALEEYLNRHDVEFFE